jgi:hypothetical protein
LGQNFTSGGADSEWELFDLDTDPYLQFFSSSRYRVVMVSISKASRDRGRYELQNLWPAEKASMGATLRKRLDSLYTWYLSDSVSAPCSRYMSLLSSRCVVCCPSKRWCELQLAIAKLWQQKMFTYNAFVYSRVRLHWWPRDSLQLNQMHLNLGSIGRVCT